MCLFVMLLRFWLFRLYFVWTPLPISFNMSFLFARGKEVFLKCRLLRRLLTVLQIYLQSFSTISGFELSLRFDFFYTLSTIPLVFVNILSWQISKEFLSVTNKLERKRRQPGIEQRRNAQILTNIKYLPWM